MAFQEGDLVLLSTSALRIARQADLRKKCRTKLLGPLAVKRVMRPVTYMIELPPTMRKVHNVFHVSRLKPYINPLHNTGPREVVIDADGTTEREVVAILGKKRENRRVYYLVQFEGDPESEAVWLPATELRNCMDLVRTFEKSTRTSNS